MTKPTFRLNRRPAESTSSSHIKNVMTNLRYFNYLKCFVGLGFQELCPEPYQDSHTTLWTPVAKETCCSMQVGWLLHS